MKNVDYYSVTIYIWWLISFVKNVGNIYIENSALFNCVSRAMGQQGANKS
jgi:hypothetical protein